MVAIDGDVCLTPGSARASSTLTRFLVVLASCATSLGCAHAGDQVSFRASGPSLLVQRPALYPETIEYDPLSRRFLLGSFREGTIYEVDAQGRTTPRVSDPRLCSVLGIAVDSERGRLWAVNADLGASLKPSSAGPKRLAAIGIYDLRTGATLNYVDVSGLSAESHLLNGIALDTAGNAYVTDSFSPNIYRIDPQGNASIMLQSERFSGPGVNLNGLVVHPDGYLLVVKKSDGSLFKVPLDAPARFSRVSIASPLVGADGVLLVGSRRLVVISNQTPDSAANSAFSLRSDDGWVTARVTASQPLGDVYPTTAVLRDRKIYVVQSKLNELIQSRPEQKASLKTQATIRQIAELEP